MGLLSLPKAYYVLYSAAFLDLCAVSMITMNLPLHLRNLGASHKVVGYIGSIYGCVQFFSSPTAGSFAEKYGKRLVMLSCISCCAALYLVLGFASSLWSIAILRACIGMFKHPLNLIQSALSDLSVRNQNIKETEALGYYQSACSLAFIVAPPIGGYLMKLDNGYSIIAMFVASIYVINIVVLQTFTCDDISVKIISAASRRDNLPQNRKSIWSLLTLSDVDQVSLWLLLLLRFLLSMTGLLWRSCYTPLYKEEYGLSTVQIGFLVSYNGIIQMLVGLTMNTMDSFFPTSLQKLTTSCLLYASSIAAVATVHDFSLLCILLFLMSLSTMLGKVSTVSYTHEVLGEEHSAMLVGFSGSITSVSRLTAPIIAGHFLDWFSIHFTLYVTGFTTLLALFVVIIVQRRIDRKVKVS